MKGLGFLMIAAILAMAGLSSGVSLEQPQNAVAACACGDECTCGPECACTAGECCALASTPVEVEEVAVPKDPLAGLMEDIPELSTILEELGPQATVRDALQEWSDRRDTQVSELEDQVDELTETALAVAEEPVTEPVEEPVPPPAVPEADPFEPPPMASEPVYEETGGFLTATEIREWIADHYTQGQRLDYDVNPRSAVWSHLQDGNDGTHIWLDEQVDDLSQWEALALHDATHKELITPTSIPQSGVAATVEDGEVTDGGDGWYYWSFNGRRYRWHTLEDGRYYGGGRFLYQGGRMHLQATQESTPPPTTPPVVLRSRSYNDDYCPECQNRRYRFRLRGW